MDESRRSPFGNTLRRLREAAALSQEELAERAGLSVRGVSDLERGARSTPRLETVRMLADGLGVDEVERHQLLEARNPTSRSARLLPGPGLPALPEPVTSFVGREDEIAEIERMIRHDHTRLITLLGPGGVGKTRIAIEAAHRLAGSVGDGAVFIDLSSVRSPDHFLPTIASRLGISEQGGGDIKDALLVALHNRHLLLILDNLEQVVEAATDVAWLHASFPNLVMITTSRIRLRVAAERVLPLEPLALPDDIDEETLQQVEAVSLFVVRAHAASSQFAINSENMSIVAEIVTRLQGMPLAIELAAARVRMLPITDMLTRLDTQLSLLGENARDAPPRQRTMRETISWSYNLLTPAEQAVFRTLAIFPDGCMLATAVAVCGVDGRFGESETLDALEALIDSSMLRRRMGADGEMRFRMLQILQEFGLEQLLVLGEDNIARRAAHVAWCVPLARRIEFFMCEPDEVYWLNRIAAEYQNVRGHLAWLVHNMCIEDALDISGSLATFRILRWHMKEGRHELEHLLVHPRAQGPSVARMRGCIGLGFICTHQGDIAPALGASREGLDLARQLGSPRDLALALNAHSISLFYSGQIDESEALYKELEAVAIAHHETFFIASTIHGRAAIADSRGDLEQSRLLLQESLRLCRAGGHVWGIALCKGNLSIQCIRSGDLDEAERLVLEAQEIFADIEGTAGSPILYLTLADIARLRNDHEEAALMLEQANTLARDNGSILDIAYSQLGLARISAHTGDLTTAQEQTYHAIQWYERSGSAVEAIRCLDVLAEIEIAHGEAARAAWCIGAVDRVLEKNGIRRTELESEEHQLRLEKIRAHIGEDEWLLHYGRGHATPLEDVIPEVQSWQFAQ